MSKPEDIPQRVWDVAEKIEAEINGYDYSAYDVQIIARAILAEREACAVIADRHSPPMFEGVTSRYIAAAIRNRGNVSTVRKSENQEG